MTARLGRYVIENPGFVDALFSAAAGVAAALAIARLVARDLAGPSGFGPEPDGRSHPDYPGANKTPSLPTEPKRTVTNEHDTPGKNVRKFRKFRTLLVPNGLRNVVFRKLDRKFRKLSNHSPMNFLNFLNFPNRLGSSNRL